MIYVLVILLDYNFAGKKEIDLTILDNRFTSLTECKKFESTYVERYKNIKGSGCLEYSK